MEHGGCGVTGDTGVPGANGEESGQKTPQSCAAAGIRMEACSEDAFY